MAIIEITMPRRFDAPIYRQRDTFAAPLCSSDASRHARPQPASRHTVYATPMTLVDINTLNYRVIAPLCTTADVYA